MGVALRSGSDALVSALGVGVLGTFVQYVVERYEGIGRISRFSISVLKEDQNAHQYEARKDQQGRWTLHKLEDQSRNQ